MTRHAPAARGFHQNKNRRGRPGGGGRARGRRRAGAPPLPGAATAPPPPWPPPAARPGRPGAGGQRAPPCLPRRPRPARARSRSRKRSPGRGPASAHPPAAGNAGPAWEAPGSGGLPPPAAACHPRHDSATHFAPGFQLRRFRRPLTWPPPPCHGTPRRPGLRPLALRGIPSLCPPHLGRHPLRTTQPTPSA